MEPEKEPALPDAKPESAPFLDRLFGRARPAGPRRPGEPYTDMPVFAGPSLRPRLWAALLALALAAGLALRGMLRPAPRAVPEPPGRGARP